MINLIIITGIYFIILLFEGPGLLLKGHIRDITFFSILWLLAYTISILIALDVPFPPLQEGIETAVIYVINMIKGIILLF